MWSIALALAGRPEMVQAWIAEGKGSEARAKCVRWKASKPDVEASLREACAEAMWRAAEDEDSFAGWVEFQVEWAGTPRVQEAWSREASARLREMGSTAAPEAYVAFMERYPETEAAKRALRLQDQASLDRVDSVASAKRAALSHRTSPGLAAAIAPYFQSFLQVTYSDETLRVSLEPPVSVDGEELTWRWAARVDGHIVPWDDAATAHLDALGVSARSIESLARRNQTPQYPPCAVSGTLLGVEVRLGLLHAFEPVLRPCGGSDVFVSLKDDALSGLSSVPGQGVRLATVEDREVVHEGPGGRSRIPVLGEPTGRVHAFGPMLAQKVGGAWLYHPLAGGLPWYAEASPPASGREIPIVPLSMPVPEGVQFMGTSSGDTRVEYSGSPHRTRILPSGRVRVLSPVLAELLDLNSDNPAFSVRRPTKLPLHFAPERGTVQPVRQVSDSSGELLHLLGVTLNKAWEVQLDVDAPLEIAFEGTVGSRRVRGVLEPSEHASTRVFLFAAEGKRSDDAFSFLHQGSVGFGWEGPDGLESVRLTPVGLLRDFTRLPNPQ